MRSEVEQFQAKAVRKPSISLLLPASAGNSDQRAELAEGVTHLVCPRSPAEAHLTSRPPRMLANKIARSIHMSFVELVRDGLRDPLRFFVLSYLLGAAMCGAWALAMEPLGRARRRVSVRN